MSKEIPEGHDAESIKLCNKHCKHDHEETMSEQMKDDIDNEVLKKVQVAATQEQPEPPKDPKPSDYCKGIIRQANELYCDFKARLYWEKILLKQYLNGRTIWTGAERGEMRNMNRTPSGRTSKLRRKKDAQNERIREIKSAQDVLTPEQVKSWCRNKKKDFLEACHGSE